MEIKKKANSIARKYHSRNPFEIIKGMNVILVYASLTGIRGFYQYSKRNNIIYIDENLPRAEQIIVCAHELGHMHLHKKYNAVFMDTHTGFVTNKFEMEAYSFAIELLLPDDILIEYKEYTPEQISRILGYNQKLIELKFKNLNLQNENVYGTCTLK